MYIPFVTDRPPRAPPPFPTRRSSDLAHQADAKIALPKAIDEDPRRRRGVHVDEPFGQGQPGMDDLALLSHAKGRDRKSTRLNSSHMSISYAVFCLKKKNLPDRPIVAA